MKIAHQFLGLLMDDNVPKQFRIPSSAKRSAGKITHQLCEYLSSLRKSHCKKLSVNNDSVDYIISQVFKKRNDYFAKEVEFNCYCRCQLVLAEEYFKKLMTKLKLENHKISYAGIRKYRLHFHDFMHDIRHFAQHFERKKDPSYIFFEGGKAYLQFGWQIFDFARKNYWGSSKMDGIGFRTRVTNSVFNLRQSLEIKLRNLIGIANIYDQQNIKPKIKFDVYKKALMNSRNAFILKRDINLENIFKIYDWTNRTIHLGEMPFIWEIYFALEYCSKIFEPEKYYPNKGWNINSAIKIIDLQKILKEFLKEFHNTQKVNKIWCVEILEEKNIEAEILDTSS